MSSKLFLPPVDQLIANKVQANDWRTRLGDQIDDRSPNRRSLYGVMNIRF